MILETLLLATALIGDSVTISGFGLTMHGLQPDPGAARLMDNKITSDGRFAYHPEIGVLVKSGNWQYGATYLQDCFNHPAGMIGGGPKIDFLNYFSVGALFGLYIREEPMTYGYAIREKTYVYTPEKMPLSRTVKGIDIGLLPGATLSARVPITKKVDFETNVLINGFLNHASFGIRVNY